MEERLIFKVQGKILKYGYNLLLVMLSSAIFFVIGYSQGDSKGEHLITALAGSKKLPPIYGDDGVMYNTLLDGPVPEVEQIVRFGPQAVPLLILHLDDGRLTKTRYLDTGLGKDKRVPLGHVCFDILTNIVRHKPPMFEEVCEGDNARACVVEKYSFEPSDFDGERKKRATGRVRRAKAEWLRAYRKHQIEYQGFSWKP